jgi:uncharacterized protein YbcI
MSTEERRDGAVVRPVGQEPTHARGVLANSISNTVVKLFSDYLGRGPTKARTVVSRDLISVVLEDTLTKAERTLVARGEESVVLQMRRALQGAMRDALVGAIEELTGRRVIAFLSDHQAEPDFAVESFVLEPLPQDEGAASERDGAF